MVTEKRCYKCKLVKPLDDFHKDKYCKDGHQYKCKLCTRKRNLAYMREHREYFKHKSKERYASVGRSQNADRYRQHRELFITRRKEYSASVVGRLRIILNSARVRARNKQLVFDLDFDWLIACYQKQDACCTLTGVPLRCSFNVDSSKRYQWDSPSLDRIDSRLGYTKANTRLVCTAINIAMNQFGEEAFRLLCEAYLEQRKTHDRKPK